MFYESDDAYETSYCHDNRCDEVDDNEDDTDLEDIESALYAQIHFHHEEEDPVLSYKGFSTSVQTLSGRSNHVKQEGNSVSRQGSHGQTRLTLAQSTASATLSTSAPLTCDNIDTVSISSGASSVCMVMDDCLSVSSDCMILDETMSDTGDILVHVQENQQTILKVANQYQPADGQEEDVQKVSVMDGMADKVAVNRYYNPISIQCHNCRERGHISNVCPKPKKSQICHQCGQTGHFFRNCPEGICYNCEGPGHTSRDCSQPRKNAWRTCYRCLMPGHSKDTCPDLWRQFHITTSKGPLQKTKMKENPKRYCCNCASRKHFGFECVENRMERHIKASYPFVSSYTHSAQSVDRRGKRDDTSGENTQIKRKKQKTECIKEKSWKPERKKIVEPSNSNWDKMVAMGVHKESSHSQGKKRKQRDESASYTHNTPQKQKKLKREYTDKDHYVKDSWYANPQHRKDRKFTSARGFRTSYYHDYN